MLHILATCKKGARFHAQNFTRGPTMSQGGTPVLGSEEIILPRWKSGPPTPVQGLSQNSTVIMLLAGFAWGNIQIQGKVIRHFQEGTWQGCSKSQ